MLKLFEGRDMQNPPAAPDSVVALLGLPEVRAAGLLQFSKEALPTPGAPCPDPATYSVAQGASSESSREFSKT